MSQQKTLNINHDVFVKVPTVEVLDLDPSKPYVVRVPKDAPNDFLKHLVDSLGAAGVFAIIIASDVSFFSTFPVDFKLVKRQAVVEADPVAESDNAPKKAKKSAPRKKKS